MPRYEIVSSGRGLFWTVTRLTDGAQLFLQGDDAEYFGTQLDATHASYDEDDVCDEYADQFTLEGGAK